MTPQNEKLVNLVSYDMVEEGELWFILKGEHEDKICRYQDHHQEDEDAEVMRVAPKGDVDMYFWDMRQRAMTIVGLKKAGFTLE